MIRRVSVLLLGGLPLIAACSGISFVKEGEDAANASCEELYGLQDESMSEDEVIPALLLAATYADEAAAANDDYEPLASAVRALNESMIVGSEDLLQSAWSNVAGICNDLP